MVIIETSTLLALYLALGAVTVLNKIISIMRTKGIFNLMYDKLVNRKNELEASIKSKKTIINGVEYIDVSSNLVNDVFDITSDIIDLVSITKNIT